MELSLRAAKPEDHSIFVPFFLSFEMPDPIPTRAWWDTACTNACFLEENGRAVGYGMAYVREGEGYVLHCAVDASARNRGVGRTMMKALAAKLRALGCDRWTLNVKADNAPALALYRRLGMEIDFPVSAMRLPWSMVDALPEGACVADAPDPSSDGATDTAFGFPSGRVARVRGMGRVIVRSITDGEITGVIAFDPDFQGAGFFRARSLADARALFAAVRSHAREPSFRLVVEDDEPFAAILIERGAERVMALMHMAGTIPRAE